MKKFIFFGVPFCIAMLALIVVDTTFAKNPAVTPAVSIRSPREHAVVTDNVLDVEVRFSSKEKGVDAPPVTN